MMLQLPNGDWVNIAHVTFVTAPDIEQMGGKHRCVVYCHEVTSRIECSSFSQACELRDKLAREVNRRLEQSSDRFGES